MLIANIIIDPINSDPRTWELTAPTIDPTSSWLLPHSTAIGWLNEEDTMSSRHLWWGPPAPTFWDHCYMNEPTVIALLREPPYSPDIAPCDFWLFPKLKKPLKGHRFDDKTRVENNATSVLKALPKSEFQDCFEKWKHRWNRVIQSSGDYFEGCHPPDDEK